MYFGYFFLTEILLPIFFTPCFTSPSPFLLQRQKKLTRNTSISKRKGLRTISNTGIIIKTDGKNLGQQFLDFAKILENLYFENSLIFLL